MSKQKVARKLIQEYDHAGRHRIVVVDSEKGVTKSGWHDASSWGRVDDLGIFTVPHGQKVVPAGLYRLVPVAHEKLQGD